MTKILMNRQIDTDTTPGFASRFLCTTLHLRWSEVYEQDNMNFEMISIVYASALSCSIHTSIYSRKYSSLPSYPVTEQIEPKIFPFWSPNSATVFQQRFSFFAKCK